MRMKKKKLLAALTCLTLLLTLLPGTSLADADASLTMGPFDDNTKTFKDAVGSGTETFSTLIVGFALSKADRSESITLPNVDGYTCQTGISSDYSQIITMSSPKTAVEIAGYIRQIEFNGGLKGQEVTVTLSKEIIAYKTFYWGGNGHYYQYVPYASGTSSDDRFYWTTAYNTAKGMTYNGRSGYLATVTSLEEDLFINKASSAIGWLGGTRLKHTGTGDWKSWGWNTTDQTGDEWYWACGPEAGMVFYNTKSVSDSNYNTYDQANAGLDYYFNWERSNGKEPNNNNPENCLATLKLSPGVGYATGQEAPNYSWNDLKNEATRTTSNWDPKGFFVEYGDQLNGDSSDGSSTSTATTIAAGAEIEAPLPAWITDAGLDKDDVHWNAREEALRLKDNVSLTDTLTLPGGTNLTLDLNDKDIVAPMGKPAIAVDDSPNGVSLNITDTASGGGAITGGNNDNGGNGSAAIDFNNAGAGSSITLTGGVSIAGGNGGAAAPSGNGGHGGAGIIGGSNTIITVNDTNSSVNGGAGGRSEAGTGGTGGAGISGGNANSVNHGTVNGGAGGSSETGAGGAGGIGMSGGSNTGTVRGGNGGNTVTGTVGAGGSAGGVTGAGSAINGNPGVIQASTYTITYNVNGGSGSMTPGSATENVPFELPACAFTAPAGQRFKEWAISSVTGTKVPANGLHTFVGNTTVYAIWENVSLPTPSITISPAAFFSQGDAPGNLTLHIDNATDLDSLEISRSGSGYTTVDSSKYVLSYSSIHIALDQGWLNTLVPGTYALRVNLAGAYADTALTTEIRVTAPAGDADAPKAGDDTPILLPGGMLLLSGAGLIMLFLRKCRRA